MKKPNTNQSTAANGVFNISGLPKCGIMNSIPFNIARIRKFLVHNPVPCRMYPLNMEDDGTFRILADPSLCKGLKEQESWQISEWLLDQGVVPYDEMNTLFSSVTIPLSAQDLDVDNPQILKMVFMALYNLDKFRDFVFQSSFLKRFEVEPTRVEKIKRSDLELLKFGFDWIKFGLLGQKLFTIKEKQAKSPAAG